MVVELLPEQAPLAHARGPHRRQPFVPRNACCMQEREGRSPRVADRRVATGEREVGEAGSVVDACRIDPEKLTSADRAACAARCVGRRVARAIEAGDQAGHVPGRNCLAEMLGEERGRVGLVVLHPLERNSAGLGKACGPLRRQIPRVEVGDDRCRFNSEESQELFGRSFERSQRFQSADVAEVLAHDRPVSNRKAEGCLEFAPHCEHRWPACGQPDGERRVAPGAANRQRCPSHAAAGPCGVF